MLLGVRVAENRSVEHGRVPRQGVGGAEILRTKAKTELAAVVSHPFHDKTVERMGHPAPGTRHLQTSRWRSLTRPRDWRMVRQSFVRALHRKAAAVGCVEELLRAPVQW